MATTHMWRPRLYANPRECLEPVFNNKRVLDWLTQIYDPKKTPIDTKHFSLVFQHYRGNSKEDFHNVFLPVHIDNTSGFACILNRGTAVLHTDKQTKKTNKVVSRTSVAFFQPTNNTVYDFSHYEDSSIGFLCIFEDEYGARHIYSFTFQRTEDGQIDIDHPTKSLYEIGAPHCQFCEYYGRKSCQCSYDFAQRARVKINSKGFNSYINFVTHEIKKKPTGKRVYIREPTGTIRLVASIEQQPRTVTHVSAWDFIGPTILPAVLPLKPNLLADTYNLLNAKINPVSNTTDDTIESSQPSAQSLTVSVTRIIESQPPMPGLLAQNSVQFLLCNGHEPQFQRHSKEPVLHFPEASRISPPQHQLQYHRNPSRRSSSREIPPDNRKRRLGITDESKDDTFECESCGKLLSSRCNKLKHVKTVHEKVKNLECLLCGAKFHQKFNLKRHHERHHSNES